MQGDNESIASFSVRSLHANVENEDIIRKIPIEEDLGSDEDLFLRGYIYLKRDEGFQSMVTEINEVIENVVMDDRATILNPLPGFVVNYRDHNYIILTPFVLWIYIFKELDSIIIKEQYEPPVEEIWIEGIREDIKIDIGSIESFEDFIRTLQLLWSSYTNKNPEDYFCSSMPWEGYDVYLLEGRTRIVTHSRSWEPDGSGRRFVEVVPARGWHKGWKSGRG